MAAGSGTASYNPPPPVPLVPRSVAVLSVGEMVLSTANRAQNPQDFWMQLHQAGIITRDELRPIVETYFTNNAARPRSSF